MELNTADLRYFQTLAKIKNITQAAKEIGITQPSLSLAIQRLEKSIGSKLFIRSKKGVVLTKSGEELLKGVSKIIEDIEKVFEKAKNMELGIHGLYRLGAHPSLALYTFKHFVPKLLKDHPQLELEFAHGLSSEVTQRLIDLEIDLAIVVNPIKHPDLVLHKLFEDEVCLFKHPKLNKPEVLFCDRSLMQSRTILKKMKDSSFKQYIHTPNLENIASLVEEKAGAGILPTRVAENFSKNLQKMDQAPIFKDEIYLAYRVENKNLNAIQKMAEYIKNSLSKI